ncbi:hypothetical protein SBV1_10009 [Verrucomicrobia bacterium]|nr:hypothetical protein SBV1_10009 [Verrucomicrobiota bacterium]
MNKTRGALRERFSSRITVCFGTHQGVRLQQSFRVHPALHEVVRAFCVKRNISVSELVRRAVKEKLARRDDGGES